MTPTKLPPSPRHRVSFNRGWRFQRGDPRGVGDALTYEKLRPWLLASSAALSDTGSVPPRPRTTPGARVSFVRPTHDDGGWRELDLPHDWGIEGPFDVDLPGETGKLPWAGVGWYRKHFKLSRADAKRDLAIDFDGAMAYSAVWLNGRFVGGWPYGYASFRLDLGPHARFGGDNTIVVRLFSPPDSSRWYPGSGIYRNVWLVRTPRVRVAHWGVFVSTPRVTDEVATVNVDVTLENATDRNTEVELHTELFELDRNDAVGRRVGTAEPFALAIPARTQALRSLVATVKRPRRWCLERPHRYLAVTMLRRAGKLVDRVETPFGIRTIRFDADAGFFLNEVPVRLQGVCMHHDLGALGAAVNERAIDRQLAILQEMGCNAIRTAHNPPAPELLDLCDRRGLLVMDEAFDCWRRGKKHPPGKREGDAGFEYHDYARVFEDWHERDLRAMVRRDRNHPCVVLWSIGNEVLEQWYSDGWKLSTRLAGIVREEDRTRPITSGFNGEIAGYSGFQTAVDVVGYNYKPQEYAPFHRRNPTRPVLGSETASCLSSRGEYFFPVEADKKHGRVDFQVSSYDQSAADWAVLPDREFQGLDECPFAAGEFVWTGFDYLGEPTPYNADATNLLNFSDPDERARMEAELSRLGRIRVASRSSYFGIIDLCGFPKDRFYLYQARWRPRLKMAHILPHWNWPERVGQVTPVHVYSAADEAELFLNGRSQGRRRRGRLEYRFRWDDVTYEPGELRAVTFKNGRKWATAVRRTTGPAHALSLVADRAPLRADGRDLAFVTAAVVDIDGQVVPRAQHLVRFRLRGPGAIAATDNGDPTSLIAFYATSRPVFNGLALVVLRARPGRRGTLRLHARADGVEPAYLELEVGRE